MDANGTGPVKVVVEDKDGLKELEQDSMMMALELIDGIGAIGGNIDKRYKTQKSKDKGAKYPKAKSPRQ
jgi:hypothetical protein